MSDGDDSKAGWGVQDPLRRMLLMTALAAYANSSIPKGFAASAADPARDAFAAVSTMLTGRTSLDPEQASRLYDALAEDDPQFPTQMQALLALIDRRQIAPLQLQLLLDAGNSALAALPRKIMTAWCIGVVGAGERAHCIAFETNLTNIIVRDHLKPPSYCYGVYGSWAQKPA
jgi:hypothetical protein